MSDNQSNKLQLSIDGMSCQACATRIEKVLSKKPEIDSVSVNFAAETLNVSYDPLQVTPDDIVEWVGKTGFTAAPLMQDNGSVGSNKPTERTDWNLVALWICLLPFLIGMAGMLLGQGMAWMIPVWLQFIIATLVQFVFAAPFYKSAWSSVRGGLANMDVLVVLGTLTIWLYSTYVWLEPYFGNGSSGSYNVDWTAVLQASAHHTPVYFEAGVMIIAFVRLGKFLEQRTKKHSLNSINLLLELTPDSVEKCINYDDIDNIKAEDKDGSTQIATKFIDVPLSEVQVDDVLRAKQGSRIGTDGIVIQGVAWCNESHLTGESEPLKKENGSKVMAGALVDNGSIVYQVTAKGQDTQLSDMVQALSEAQGSKADLARLADKVAAIFVPVVVGLAILTFVITWWLTGQTDKSIMHAVSVLVIACPCALGLATPAAIMAGMGVAARHGIWFKDSHSLEMAGDIDIVVFDKTGTLTLGRPKVVTHMMSHSSISVNEVLQLAASVEAHTSHPIASAIVKAAQEKNLNLLDVHNVDAILGEGVQADIAGMGQVKVGTPEFVGMKLPKHLPKVWKIASTVAVSTDGVALGMFALIDDIKEESRLTLTELQNNGKEVILLSGDKQSVVAYVAEKLGIGNIAAEKNPREKADYISKLQAKGYKVAMVGDGVNDAPAMATANASFAMVEGTDVARHSASARLMGKSLIQVNTGLEIAEATVRNIKQNLFFAFIYNCLGIPLAAFGFLNPMIAAIAMALSSISVLLNALRLTRYNKEDISDSNDQDTIQGE